MPGSRSEETNCAGFDVERARLYQAGAVAVGFDDEDELAQLTDGGIDLSGRAVEIVLPPEALRVLGQDFGFKHRLPKIALETRLIPDWEYPGYWLTKDNREPVAGRPRRPARRPPGGLGEPSSRRSAARGCTGRADG